MVSGGGGNAASALLARLISIKRASSFLVVPPSTLCLEEELSQKTDDKASNKIYLDKFHASMLSFLERNPQFAR